MYILLIRQYLIFIELPKYSGLFYQKKKKIQVCTSKYSINPTVCLNNPKKIPTSTYTKLYKIKFLLQ